MLDTNKIAVISSGNGGQSMAAYLKHAGYHISLYVREQERVKMFPGDRVFQLTGFLEANPVIDCISHRMEEVIQDAHLIMVTTPAQYHHVVARTMASCLQDGQIVVLNPGRTFGTYEVKKTLEDESCQASVIIAEAETFIFACRCARLAEPIIYGIKSCVKVAAHNPSDTPKVVEALSQLFPGIIKSAKNTLYTSFSNVGVVFHPLPILLNITRVEAKEKFQYYIKGISPLVANILERLDKERIAVAKAYGADVLSAYDWMGEHYGSEGETLYERIQNNAAYINIVAPTDIDTRYVFEDMLTGCVPMYYAGKAIGVETPIMNSAILWASTIYETDFFQNGRGENMVNFSELLETARKSQDIHMETADC